MTPRNWGVRECAVAACLILVAAGVGVGLLVWNRQYFLLALAVGTSHYLAYKLPNRNLIAELANRDATLDAWNLSAKRTDLDQVGAVSPPKGTLVVAQEVLDAFPTAPTDVFGAPVGDLFGMPVKASPFVPEGTAYVIPDDPEPPSWMDQSGYRPPPAAQRQVVFEDDDDPSELRPLATGGVVPSSTAITFSESDGCVVPLQEWADRLAVLPGCVWESCPHADRCVSECRWVDHTAPLPDLDASDGPRSLPTPRID